MSFRSLSLIRATLLVVALTPLAAGAAPSPRDAQRDFDWAPGTWRTELQRLHKPLSGSTTWVKYTGTSVARAVWGGRANLLELDVSGPAGRIEGLSLRLFDPGSGKWSLNFASPRGGGMAPPTVGGFDASGRGEFFNDETYDGRPIKVRFVITPVTPDQYRFEQAFSADGGQTWEVNWIAVDTRVGS
jgi:hypothetical protein